MFCFAYGFVSVLDHSDARKIKEAVNATFTSEQRRAFVIAGYDNSRGGAVSLLEAKQGGM